MRATPLSIPMPCSRIEALRFSWVTLAVGGATLVAFALRLFWVYYTDSIPLGGDPHWYYTVGINLAKGFGFVASRNTLHEIVGPGEPTAYWPPGYPFALAGVFKVFGAGITQAKIANAVLGAAAVPFVYALGASLFDRRAGVAAASLFAVFPNSIAWTPILFPEPLFTLLLVAALWLLTLQPPARREWLPAAAFGFLLALAALTRGQGIVLLPVAMVYWAARWGAGTAVRHTGVALLVAAATIAPWTVRNAVELHAFIPISTNSSSVLRMGHAPDATGYTFWTRDEIDGVLMEESLYRPDWEVEAYREYPGRAIDYALAHPLREFQLAGLKLYYVYVSDAGVVSWLSTIEATPLRPEGLDDALWYLFTYSYYGLFFAAVLSVPLWLRREPGRLLLGSVFLFWSLFHIVFAGDVRYHVPLYPFFAIAVASGAFSAADRLRAAVGARTVLLQRARYTEPPLDAPIV